MINNGLECGTDEEKRDYLIQTIIDQILNYNTTKSELEEYICSFMLDEFNVIWDEGDDTSYQEIAETVLWVYDQSKQNKTEELERLRDIDLKMKEYNKQKLQNEIEMQKKFEEHMKN